MVVLIALLICIASTISAQNVQYAVLEGYLGAGCTPQPYGRSFVVVNSCQPASEQVLGAVIQSSYAVANSTLFHQYLYTDTSCSIPASTVPTYVDQNPYLYLNQCGIYNQGYTKYTGITLNPFNNPSEGIPLPAFSILVNQGYTCNFSAPIIEFGVESVGCTVNDDTGSVLTACNETGVYFSLFTDTTTCDSTAASSVTNYSLPVQECYFGQYLQCLPASPTQAPTPAPTQPAGCTGNNLVISQAQQSSYFGGSTWNVSVAVESSSIYSLTVNIVPPAGSSIVSVWGATHTSGSMYTVNDWRFTSKLQVHPGTVLSFGYQVSSSSQASVSVATPGCTPPPKHCTVVLNQQLQNQWNNGSYINYQYGITPKNVGSDPASSVDITIAVQAANAVVSPLFNMVITSPLSSGVAGANIPLYVLQPGNTATASVYPLQVSVPVADGSAAAPALSVVAYNCYYG